MTTYELTGQPHWIYGIKVIPYPTVPDLIRIPINDRLVFVLMSHTYKLIIIENPFDNEYYFFKLDDYTEFTGNIVDFVIAKLDTVFRLDPEDRWALTDAWAKKEIKGWKFKFKNGGGEWIALEGFNWKDKIESS